ncbi:MAG: sialate O-acetylesterase [Pseudoxanthomonas sp.]
MEPTRLRCLVLIFLLLPLCAQARVELPLLFSDGAVLQRDQPVPVWGWSEPGAKVTVTFDGHSANATAAADGAWRAVLPAHAAGGPYVLEVSAGHDNARMQDVLVGEVWLASGQSNMEMSLQQTDGAKQAIAEANDPLIRHFKIPKSWSGSPQRQLQGGSWIAASPQAAGQFSAPAYYFARELRKSTGVAVGIIDSTWGGSRIEAWMDAAAQGVDPAQAQAVERDARAADARALAETKRRLAQWPQGAADDSGWQVAGLDTAGWVSIPMTGTWESSGWLGLDGIAWYRTTFTLSADEAKAGIALGVGRIDDSDVTWVNGVQIGATENQYNLAREYAVPATALHAGVNEIAIRVTDAGGGGGLHGDRSERFVQPRGAAKRSLDGDWRFRVADAKLAPVNETRNQVPTLLYNAMIHPLQPFPLRGVIWYQGESNAGSVENALRYRTLFPAMIRQWRAQWNAPALPFLWVQLASFVSADDTAAQSPWSVLRESQSAALALPATAQAVTLDIGDSHDIHPRNKRDVGLRLALAARHVAYGEPVDYHGPTPRHIGFADGKARVEFDVGSTQLAVRQGGSVRGFELAGDDHIFHAANAVIEGGNVDVRSDAVPAPVALRYGWHDDAGDADLANSAGLPASPFRTDAW